jgi:diguanylate cyclase (GGDEF)-like protein
MTAIVTIALSITAIVYVLLGFLLWGRSTRRDASWLLAWTMFAMAWWTEGYAEEIIVPTLLEKMLWVRIEYPAIVAAPVLWLLFVLEYTGHSTLLNRRNLSLLFAVPVFVVLANWTNDFHHLYYGAVQLQTIEGLSLSVLEHGRLYWVNVVYSYLMIGSGCVLLLFHAFRTMPLYRSQTILLLLASLAPFIGSIVFVLGVFPVEGLDPTPFAFIPTGLIMAWIIARYRFLNVIAPTQDVILQSLRDGVLLLDTQKQVVYINRVAEDILSVRADKVLGGPAGLACGACSESILPALGTEEQQVEVSLPFHGSERHFEVLIMPRVEAGASHGYTILFHDITRRKQAQAELKNHDAIFQAVGLASELFLKSEKWEGNIPTVLERLGHAAEVSRVYIFELENGEVGRPRISQRYEWVRDGVRPRIDRLDFQRLDWIPSGFARWYETLRGRAAIHGPVRDFPQSERVFLEKQGILSLVATPVFVEDRLWGFVGFDDCATERAWGQTELEALQAAADIFGAALTRGLIESRLLKRQRSLSLLHNILRAALSSPDFETMVQRIVDDLMRLLNADNCFFTSWDPVRRVTVPIAVSGANFPSSAYRNIKINPGERTFTETALEQGHSLVVEDVHASPFISQRLNDARVVSALTVPLIEDQQGLGAVIFSFHQTHKFTPEEIGIAEEASSLVALALAKFKAVDAANRRAEEANTLRRAGVAISETLDLQEATTRLLEQLAFVLPHDSASVQLLHDGELEIIGGEGWDNPSTILGVRFPIPDNNPNTIVIQTRKPYLVHDTYEAFPNFRKISHAAHIRSWLGVPLIVHNKIIGLLAIDSREPDHFTADNIDLATAFAGQVAVAIENARLFEEVQRLAVTDGLTGLTNHRHFMALAQIEVQRSMRYKKDLSVMIFDIDHFKRVNDEYGHPIGDKVLCAVASLCKENLREADPVARYGGEEFVALILETPAAVARLVGERMRKAVEDLVVPTEKGNVHVTVSVGIAGLDGTVSSLDTLINRADQALYAAKSRGRNQVVAAGDPLQTG